MNVYHAIVNLTLTIIVAVVITMIMVQQAATVKTPQYIKLGRIIIAAVWMLVAMQLITLAVVV